MRGKDYNTGLRGVLFEARHCARMGSAVWLYGWLVLRQTHQSGGLGWVLGGAPVCYREIEEETGFNRRTLERWMHVLRKQGYIETQAAPGGVVIRITKAKKFTHPPRGVAEGVRRTAGEGPHNRVASGQQVHLNHEDSGRIGSSFVAGIKERADAQDFHRDFHKGPLSANHSLPPDKNQGKTSNPSCLEGSQNRKAEFQVRIQPATQPPARPLGDAPEQFNLLQESRLRQQSLRAEREEAVRRELNAGRGPELRRS